MEVTVKYFGLLIDVTHRKEEVIVLDNQKLSVADFKIKVENSYPELKNTNFSIAVNQLICNKDFLIKDKDVIAFLPPFAGG